MGNNEKDEISFYNMIIIIIITTMTTMRKFIFYLRPSPLKRQSNLKNFPFANPYYQFEWSLMKDENWKHVNGSLWSPHSWKFCGYTYENLHIPGRVCGRYASKISIMHISFGVPWKFCISILHLKQFLSKRVLNWFSEKDLKTYFFLQVVYSKIWISQFCTCWRKGSNSKHHNGNSYWTLLETWFQSY